MKIRLQKFLAERGVGSRRKIEEMMKKRLIKVNGELAELGVKVDENDKIEIKGSPFAKSSGDINKIYIMFNKPWGVLSTCVRSREKGKTVLDYVKVKERIYPVGRLDKDSEGLLILTNDGELALKLTHPRYEHEKQYLVKYRAIKELTNKRKKVNKVNTVVNKVNNDENNQKQGENGRLRIEDRFDSKLVRQLEKGVDIGGYITRKSTVFPLTLDSFLITLKEGKKRQIRRMCEAVGLRVTKLVRVRIGGLEFGDLKTGEWRYLDEEEVGRLLMVDS